MADFVPMINALRIVGEDPAAVLGAETAHVLVYGQELASVRSLPGVTLDARSEHGVIHATVVIAAGVHLAKPVHLCFGLSRPSCVFQRSWTPVTV